MANISFGTAALAICICSYSAEDKKKQKKQEAAGTVLLTGASANCHRFLFTFASVVFGEFSTKHFTFPFCNNFARCAFKCPLFKRFVYQRFFGSSMQRKNICKKKILEQFSILIKYIAFWQHTLRMRYA